MTDPLILASLTLFAVVLVELHGPDGKQIIYVNPVEITSIRAPTVDAGHHFARGTHCVVVMVNRNFIATHETCEEIRAKLPAN
jgi:hypothetical protein